MTPAAIRLPTLRKRQIIALVAAGYTTKAISFELGLSSSAVEKHLRQLFTRYGAPNRAALVSEAYCRGVLLVTLL